MTTGLGKGLLAGVKVVEFAQVVAGPLAGGMLADQGADVVHVESPRGGDSARVMGPAKDGVYLWWKVSGRNKRSVTLDLHHPEGQDLAHQLVAWADVVILSLRPKTLRAWRLDWESLRTINPRLVVLQVSGYGATSSLADSPGFGKMGEARSGVVHLTGEADGRPIHTGFSHADSVTGLMGAFGILAALHRRDSDQDFSGEWVDIALFEPLFRLIEWQVIIHDQLGTIPHRSGNKLAVSPAAVINTYQSASGEWITVTSATQRSVLNVVGMLGLPREDFLRPEDQRAGAELLDDRLRSWMAQRPTDECLMLMAEAEVVASRIFDASDIATDPIYAERNDIISVSDPELGPVRMQAVIPHVAVHPGEIWRTGPSLGEDNALVYGEWLGIDAAQRQSLAQRGVI